MNIPIEEPFEFREYAEIVLFLQRDSNIYIGPFVAVRLLQLRDIARLTPERLAQADLPPDLVTVVATLAEVPPQSLTVGTFWREVARFGGYLGRRGDGPPGWKTLWRGWLYLQTVLEGVYLAPRLPPKRCG